MVNSSRFHSGIGMTPFEALFGKKMILGCEKDPGFTRDPEEPEGETETDQQVNFYLNIKHKVNIRKNSS
jgi:hypothetical protein